MPTEAGDHEETGDIARGPDDGHCVRSHFIQPRPRVRYACFSKTRQPLHRRSIDSLEKLPAHRCVVTRRLVRVYHAKQNAGAFSMKVEGRLEVYDHDSRCRDGSRFDWFSDENVTSIRKHRNG